MMYETFSSRDDYELMESDREIYDQWEEERFRDAEINFGLEAEIYEMPVRVPLKETCSCCLCNRDNILNDPGRWLVKRPTNAVASLTGTATREAA